MSFLIDKYGIENASNSNFIRASLPYRGQSFYNPKLIKLEKAIIPLAITAGTTGTCFVKIYAQTGTYGSSNDKPTGDALAVSDGVDISGLSTIDFEEITFNFSGANQIFLEAGTHYCVELYFPYGDTTYYVLYGTDLVTLAHPGVENYSYDGITWGNFTLRDMCFAVYGFDPYPTITNVSPNEGVTGEELTVTLTGNFIDISEIYFNGVPAKNWVQTSETTIDAIPPNLPKGTFHITAESTSWGLSVETNNDLFTVTLADGIYVFINNEDITKKVQMGSLKIENILTRKRDSCSFRVVSYEGNAYRPYNGRDIVIYLDNVKVFGGVITEVEMNSGNYAVVEWNVKAIDYTRLLDQKLVVKSYKDQTVDQIIADLILNYAPNGFTGINVNCPVNVDTVTFNYLQLSKCIEQLADQVGYDWYVDYDKDIHFFDKENNPAPFDVTDNNANHEYQSLLIRQDNSQIRNTVYVRGGEYIGTQFTSEIECNGVDTIYPLPYKYKDFSATLTGQKLNVGTDYIDNENTKDALYNFGEKIIRFRDARKPSVGSILRIGGKPYLPVIFKAKNQESINAMVSAEGGDGIYEYVIIDKSITSREEASQRALAEMTTYATTLSEGEFMTETAGLKAGMKIRIQSASRGVDEYYVINRVVMKEFTNGTLLYQISLVTTKTFDLIDLLSKIVTKDTKGIVIGQNEILDVTDSANETVSVTELFTAQSLSYEVEFVAGTLTAMIPEGLKRIFIVGGSVLG